MKVFGHCNSFQEYRCTFCEQDYVQTSLLFHAFFTFLIYYIQVSISTRGVLKLLVTKFFNIFEALKKEPTYYYVKKNGAKETYPEPDKYSPHSTTVDFLPR